MAVRDDARHQPGIAQLVPDVIRMTPDLAVSSVAQVGTQTCPGIDSRFDLLCVRSRVTDRNDQARIDGFPDKRHGTFGFGSQCDQPDPSAGSFLVLAEFIPVRLADVLQRMSASRPVFFRNVRSFEMAAGHHLIGPGRLFAGLPDRGESGQKRFVRGGHQSGHQPRDTELRVRFEN